MPSHGTAVWNQRRGTDNQLRQRAEFAPPLGSRVVLDQAGPWAVHRETAKCLEEKIGRCALLEAVHAGCQHLSRRLAPPQNNGASYLSRAMGRPDPALALAALDDRQSSHKAMDSALSHALRLELQTVERCITETQMELEALAAQGGCNVTLQG